MGLFFTRLLGKTLHDANHTEQGNKDIAELLESGKTLRYSSPRSTRLSYSLSEPKWQQISDITTGVEKGEHKPDEQLFQKDVPSSAIDRIKYDPQTLLLSVVFAGGKKVYNYFRVPPEKIQEMLSAPSIGQYFMKNIHDQYTANPGHRRDVNKRRNANPATTYKVMTKDYKRIMKGHKLIE